MMKRKVARLRLSPNEESQLIREEHERRRKLRIQQVREQERYIALRIRKEVQQRRERELQNLAEELKEEWESQQKEKLETLQKLFQDNLSVLGEGHRSAKENEPDWKAIAQKEDENRVRAEERFRGALKELKSHRQKEQEEQKRPVEARKKAMQVEKERAAKVADLPPLPPNPIENIESKKPGPVKKWDVDGFSETHYHMAETAVDREMDTEQPNACELAAKEAQRLQELGEEDQRERQEQLEKARLRGNHALRREQLTQDRDRFLVELEHMQQTDLRRRRLEVAQMPAQIFQPLHKRREAREDWQGDMEVAFEDMYTGERRVKGDLVLQLVPEPLLAESTGSQDEDLDLTLEENAAHLEPPARAEKDEASTEGEDPSRPPGVAPRQALKNLLNRIRSQRDQWSYRGRDDPLPDPQTAPRAERTLATDGMTIETGSLASEESEEPYTASARLQEPSQSAQETTEESIVAGNLLHPDKQAFKINAFETERRRREDELERQKQEQIALLQELEEKKCRLELLLLEAQQEKEQLKIAMTQDTAAPSGLQTAPSQDGVCLASPSPQPTVPKAVNDEHLRQIRQYQQRLVEQNRLHQRSVEQARRRLEEYQRTLRNRYCGGTTSTCLPPALSPPHLHVATVPPTLEALVELPSGPFLPSSLPMEILTREPSVLSPTLFHPGLGTPVDVFPERLDQAARNLPDRRGGVSAWPADTGCERVTKGLQGGLSSPPSSLDPLSHGPPPCPLHPASLVPPIGPALSQGVATPAWEAPVQPGPVPQTSVRMREETERQRQELREAKRRVEAQREELSLQQRELQEVQRMRQREELLKVQRELDEVQRMRPREELQMVQRELDEVQRMRQREELQKVQRELDEVQRMRQREELQKVQRELDEVQRMRQREELQKVQRELDEVQRMRQREELQKVQRELDEVQRMTPREELQTLLTDDDTAHDAARGPGRGSEVTGAARLSLMASLLRAMEESDGSSSSGASQSQDGAPNVQPQHPDGLASHPLSHPHPRAAKPPVARARLGVTDVAMEQHELSAIQEVETPVNASLIAEECFRGSRTEKAVPEEQELSDRGPGSSSLSTAGGPSSEAMSQTGTESGRSSQLSWRERLRLEAGASLEPGFTPAQPGPSRCVSGFGKGVAGESVPQLESMSVPSGHLSSEPDNLSSTTISSGSYATTDPDHNSTHIDSMLLAGIGGGERTWPANGLSSPRRSSRQDVSGSPLADSLLHHSSIQSIIDKYTREFNLSLSSTGNPTGFSEGTEGSVFEGSGSSVSQQQPWSRVLQESEGLVRSPVSDADPHSCLSDPQPGDQRLYQEWDNRVDGIMDRFSDKSSSLVVDRGRDSTVSPVIGPPSVQSSSVGIDQGRDSIVGHMIGQPSAMDLEKNSALSQMIGLLSSMSTSSDQRWDSTLSRMIAGLSSQSASASQLIDRMGLDHSSPWLDEGQDDSRMMRPLVGELDESAVQQSQISGADSSNSQGWVDLEGSGLAGVLSEPEGGPDASLSSTGPPGLETPPHPFYQNLQPPGAVSQEEDQAGDSFYPLQAEVTHNETADAAAMTCPHSEVEGSWSSGADGSNSQGWVDLEGSAQAGVSSEPEGGHDASLSSSAPPGLETPPHPLYQSRQPPGAVSQEEDQPGDPASDSFHSLLAQVTQNQTAEPSIISAHLPEQKADGSYSHHEETDRDISAGDHDPSTCSEELEDNRGSSTSSDPSPERLRGGEEPPQPLSALQDSLYQLTLSQGPFHYSALVGSPEEAVVGLAVFSLSGLSCEDTPTLDMPPAGETNMNSATRPQDADKGGAVCFEDLGAGREDSQQCSMSSAPVWERIKEEGIGKGIMDESMLTLVSLTDTTLQDQEVSLIEVGDMKVSHREDRENEDLLDKGMRSGLSLVGDSRMNDPTSSHAVMLLEFQSCPTVNLQQAFQQKRRVLIQRSTRRVEGIQARRAEVRAKPQSDSTETKVKTNPRAQSAPTTVLSSITKPRREERTALSSHLGGDKQRKQKSRDPLPTSVQVSVSEPKLNKSGELRINPSETRKRDGIEMRLRTERLYSRLEEVKNQKELRSRREAYAENREKAKEFHKKTLQKLRAKQTLH